MSNSAGRLDLARCHNAKILSDSTWLLGKQVSAERSITSKGLRFFKSKFPARPEYLSFPLSSQMITNNPRTRAVEWLELDSDVL